jgi:hypothetical protein
MTKFCNTRSARSAALESTESSVAVAPQQVEEIVGPLKAISGIVYSQKSRGTSRYGIRTQTIDRVPNGNTIPWAMASQLLFCNRRIGLIRPPDGARHNLRRAIAGDASTSNSVKRLRSDSTDKYRVQSQDMVRLIDELSTENALEAGKGCRCS